MANKYTLLEKLGMAIAIAGGMALFVPIPFTWLGYKEIKYNNVLYDVWQGEDRTLIVRNSGIYGFLEWRIDENNDGRLDSHYLRSIMPTQKHGWIHLPRSVTEEDQKLYDGIRKEIKKNATKRV